MKVNVDQSKINTVHAQFDEKQLTKEVAQLVRENWFYADIKVIVYPFRARKCFSLLLILLACVSVSGPGLGEA